MAYRQPRRSLTALSMAYRLPVVSPYSSAEIFSLFTEDNMALTDSTMLTPALRFDHHSIVGNNWSPSLNLSQELTDDWTLKLGIARATRRLTSTS